MFFCPCWFFGRFLLLLCIALVYSSCSKKEEQGIAATEKLPQVYGVYIIDEGKSIRIDTPSVTSPKVTGSARAIIFDKRISTGALDVSRGARIVRRKHVPLEVEHVHVAKGAPPARITLKHVDYYVPFEIASDLDVAPIPNQPEMVRLSHRAPLPKGLYYLALPGSLYPFAVDVEDAEARNVEFIHKHYKTIDKDAPFSWGGWNALTQGDPNAERIYNGNTITAIEWKPASELDALVATARQAAITHAKAGRLRAAAAELRRVSEFAKPDPEVSKTIASIFSTEAQRLLDAGHISASAAVSVAGSTLAPDEKLHQLSIDSVRKLSDWNKEMRAATARSGTSEQKPRTVLFKAIDGELADAGTHTGKSSNFEITNTGIEGDFQNDGNGSGRARLMFNNVRRIQSETVSLSVRFLTFEEFPGLAINVHSGYDWQIGFKSAGRRDQARKAIAAAMKEWRENTFYGQVVAALDSEAGTLTFRIQTSNEGWTPIVPLPAGWSFDKSRLPGGVRIWNVDTGEIADGYGDDPILEPGQRYRFLGSSDAAFSLVCAMP